MTDTERQQLKEYAERWKRVGPLLEAQREEDVRRSDKVSKMATFERLWDDVVRDWPPAATSGLVAQQLWFMIIAERANLGSVQ